MMSFELRGEGSEELNVFLDKEGLASLLAQLKFLKDEQTDHVHLFAESWGGHDLTEEAIETASKPMRHVKITMQQQPL